MNSKSAIYLSIISSGFFINMIIPFATMFGIGACPLFIACFKNYFGTKKTLLITAATWMVNLLMFGGFAYLISFSLTLQHYLTSSFDIFPNISVYQQTYANDPATMQQIQNAYNMINTLKIEAEATTFPMMLIGSYIGSYIAVLVAYKVLKHAKFYSIMPNLSKPSKLD